MKTRLITLTYRGSASVDPRYSAAMLPWTINDIRSMENYTRLYDNEGDLLIGDSACTYSRQQLFASSQYHTYQMRIVFRQHTAFSPLNVLTLPFDFYTWIVLSITFLTKWILEVQIQSLAPRFGFEKRDCKRLILTSLFLNSLILRSCYEGSVFKYLHNMPTQILPKSLEDAIKQKYKFIVSPSGYALYSLIPELKNHLVVYEYSKTLETFFSLKGKYGFISSKENMALRSNGRRYFMVKKPLLSIIACMYFPKNSPLAEEFDFRLLQLAEHGHTSFVYKVAKPRMTVGKNQSNFTLIHLIGVFELFSILICVSLCVFVIELISPKSVRLRLALDKIQ